MEQPPILERARRISTCAAQHDEGNRQQSDDDANGVEAQEQKGDGAGKIDAAQHPGLCPPEVSGRGIDARRVEQRGKDQQKAGQHTPEKDEVGWVIGEKEEIDLGDINVHWSVFLSQRGLLSSIYW